MYESRLPAAALLTAVLTLAGTALGGTTGSLMGIVTDASGDPVTGASVMLEGTGLGAMTDAGGGYYLYAVVPGTYSVTARMVGSETVTKDGVRIVSDQSTRVDFVLGTAPVGHTVIEVRDQRNLVLETVPSTIHVIDYSEIRLLPVPGMLEILLRQPGVISQGGGIHIRGGRSGEVAYLLDGIPVRSPITNTFSAITPISAISETSVITGGASAEYGNAMSGVVNMVSRDGGSTLEGYVTSLGGDLDEFGAEDATRNYSEPSENDNYRGDCIDSEVALGGPEPLTSLLLPAIGIDIPGEVTFFGSARVLVSGRNLEDSRGNWENNWQNGFNGSLKVTARFSPRTRISVMGYYNYRQSGWDEWAWSLYEEPMYIEGEPALGGDPDYAIPIRFQETGGVTASLTRMLTDDTFLDFRINRTRYCHWRRIQDPDGGYFGEAYSPSDWIMMYFPQPRMVDSLGFYHSGMHPEVWLESKSEVTTGRIDFTSRLSDLVELKTGIEASSFDIYDYSVYIADEGSAFVSLWEAWPWSGALYGQTSLRFGSGMVMNTGLRLDVFDPNCSMFDIEEGGSVEVEAKTQLSPRFGITHPVSDRDVFFATYGHYFQMPNLNEMFYGTDYNIAGLYSIIGNPDLEAERTVAYEAGVRHRFSDDASLAVSAYYKDITGLVRTSQYFSETYDYYFLYENDDSHGTVRGMELKILRLPTGWVSGSLSYTYSIAMGRYSSPTEGWEWVSGGFMTPTTDSYLDWDQRHTAEASVVMAVPRGEGPVTGGFRPLEGFSLTLDWQFGSGFPYSPPTGGSVQPEINTLRYPWTMQTDMGIGRRIWLGQTEMDIALNVYNLFDRRNLNKIYDVGHYIETGEPGGVGANPGAWSSSRHAFLKVGFSW